MNLSPASTPLRVVVTYVVVAGLWIIGSDAALAWYADEPPRAWLLDSAKGLLFVGATAILLFILTRRLLGEHRATEDELRSNRSRWQQALRSAGIGTWEWREDGRVRYSAEWRSMLGYSEAEVPDDFEAWMGLVHPRDRDRVRQQLDHHLSGALPSYECEYRTRAKDGTYRWMLARGRVTSRHPDGRPREAFGTHTDITDRRNAEARTADTLAFAEAVLHNSPVGVSVYGPDGRAVVANRAAARMVGTDVTGLLRQNFRELASWKQSGLLAAAERALATQTAVAHRTELTTSFGRALYVEAHLVPFKFGGAQQLLVLLDDETTERRAAKELNRLHAAVQAAPSAWVITDATGTVEWVNPAFARLTGYSAEEVVGRNPRMLRSGRHDEAFYRQMWETIRRGEVWSGEVCNRRKDGTLYQEEMTIAPVKDDTGVIRHFVAIKTDVSAHKELERQLQRTQRLESIGMLASGIAHDLNNVLTPILLSIELLKAKFPLPDAQSYIGTVESAAQRGAGIVRQVLTFARGLDDGQRVELQPRYLLKDVVQLVEETFPRNIRVRTDVARDVHAVRGDLTQLHQVILNLAVNARDAMPDGGELGLAMRNERVQAPPPAAPALKPGDYVIVAVSDTGCGIAPEVIEHMFEPFFTTKPRGKGTGLGLSTVYGIVRSHGGAIQVTTKLGQGTTFEVYLPAAQAGSAPAAPAPAAVGIQGRGRRVLVVDDEEPIRSVMIRLLGRHGFVPVVAPDGLSGLAEFERAPGAFAAAVVDMMMPRMDGTALTRRLREAAPGLPVIISTGLIGDQAEPAIEDELRRLGVQIFLHKPFTAEEMLAALGTALAGAAPAAPAATSLPAC